LDYIAAELQVDFPWKGRGDSARHLMYLLTCVARPILNASPFFVAAGAEAGTGKDKRSSPLGDRLKREFVVDPDGSPSRTSVRIVSSSCIRVQAMTSRHRSITLVARNACGERSGPTAPDELPTAKYGAKLTRE
jgi:hypothetical protein